MCSCPDINVTRVTHRSTGAIKGAIEQGIIENTATSLMKADRVCSMALTLWIVINEKRSEMLKAVKHEMELNVV